MTDRDIYVDHCGVSGAGVYRVHHQGTIVVIHLVVQRGAGSGNREATGTGKLGVVHCAWGVCGDR